LAEQHIILEKAFDSWTADAKQLDDVSFIGIEL
jgi:hypothetical protein